MWLINAHSRKLQYFTDGKVPHYAILSHTWGSDEITFQDMGKVRSPNLETRPGYRKIEYTCRQAIRDQLSWVWVDTCCIDKRSSAELSEAINSMFRWYHGATVCYAYLDDYQIHQDGGSQLDHVLSLDTVAKKGRTSASRNSSGSQVGESEPHAQRRRDLSTDEDEDMFHAKYLERRRKNTSFSSLIRRAADYVMADDGSDESPPSQSPAGKVVPEYESSAYTLTLRKGRHITLKEGQGNMKLKHCRWFFRGWTLQELIAPKAVVFYGRQWSHIGSRYTLLNELAEVTGIDQGTLDWSNQSLDGDPHSVTEQQLRNVLQSCSVAQRMSWASSRETTRVEDAAYSLLGLFDVNMPLLYGEGNKAFARLQEEIVRSSTDQSLFAWVREPHCTAHDDTDTANTLLAPNASYFARCGSIEARAHMLERHSYDMTNLGLRITMPVAQISPRIVGMLNCGYVEGPDELITLELGKTQNVYHVRRARGCNTASLTRERLHHSWQLKTITIARSKPPAPDIVVTADEVHAGPVALSDIVDAQGDGEGSNGLPQDGSSYKLRRLREGEAGRVSSTLDGSNDVT